MSLHRCRECGYYVSPLDAHCPDCGAYRPSGRQSGVWLALGGGIASAVVTYLGIMQVRTLDSSWPTGAAVVAVFIGLLVSLAVAGNWQGLVYDRHRDTNAMADQTRRIRRRLRELDAKVEALALVRRRIERHESDPEWDRILASVRTAEEVVPRHRDRYRLCLFDIEVARWLNSAQPLSVGTDGLSFNQCERRLAGLDEWSRDGARMLEDWRLSGLDRLTEATHSEQRLTAALAAGTELRKALIARQARSVVASVSPDDVVSMPVAPPSALADLAGKISAREELGTLAVELDELEAEHARISAVLEVESMVVRR